LNWLGDRADEQIAHITQADLLACRETELERVTVTNRKPRNQISADCFQVGKRRWTYCGKSSRWSEKCKTNRAKEFAARLRSTN
jgi:hypothetical protein